MRQLISGLVSVIIPVYNRPALLREAVASALGQTYRPIEIIIVNDGSTDETSEVADELGRTHPDIITAIHRTNGGPGPARETGRQASHGEFIQYLDSDDLLLSRKLEVQVSGLNSNADCGVAYGKTRYRRADGTVAQGAWKRSGIKMPTMFPSFLIDRWWDTPTPLYRSELCDVAGPWTALRLEEDWEYDCRIAALGVRLYFCDEFVAEVRDHADQRLCKGNARDPIRLTERARAHKLIFSHAERAGIGETSPEMQHFARELFLLSRQCGAAGLERDSIELFSLSRVASGKSRSEAIDYTTYQLLARILGWSRLGRLACYADSFRR